MSIVVSFLMIIISLIVVVSLRKKKSPQLEKQQNIINKEPIDVYQIYLNECKKEKISPISRLEFNKLKNKQINIRISDILSGKTNPKLVKTNKNIDIDENFFLIEDSEEGEEENEIDNGFINSAIFGYMTNSTTKGTLLGGNFLGGLLGDYLNKKPKK